MDYQMLKLFLITLKWRLLPDLENMAENDNICHG